MLVFNLRVVVIVMILTVLWVPIPGSISVEAAAGSGRANDVHHASTTRVLFTHVSPDGSRVVARSVSVPYSTCPTAHRNPPPGCGTIVAHVPSTEFDFTVDRRKFQSVELASDPRLKTPALMTPLYATTFSDSARSHDPNVALIILHVRAPVAVVRLTKSGLGGASPLGDHMVPVDGWVAFPIHNFKNLGHLEAFDATGKVIGTSLPFPCC